MGAKEDVEKTLPGLRFTVRGSGKHATPSGKIIGELVLRCEIIDPALWEPAIKKLDGLKIFSTSIEEVLDALGEELNNKEVSLSEEQEKNVELMKSNMALSAEVDRLRVLLSGIGVDLGLE